MKIALLQMSSVLDANENKLFIEEELSKSWDKKIKALFLPECFWSISDGSNLTPFCIKSIDEIKWLQDLAVKYDTYILGGSAITLERGKTYNRCYNINPQGELLSHYDKIHLFKYSNLVEKSSSSSSRFDESQIYDSGKELTIVSCEKFRIGMSICFDLRFPELYKSYAVRGVDVLSVSSAFTYETGKAHWHCLLKARAIETQSYVIACNQVGQHNKRLKTYGHSLVIDPWGKTLLDMKDKIGLGIISLDYDVVKGTREKMNTLWSHLLG